MTSRNGYKDRLDGLKYEEQLAQIHNTQVIGRSGGKADTSDKKSIKNSGSSSTQVHLTTMNQLKQRFDIDKSGLFTKWLGTDPSVRNKRYALKEFSEDQTITMISELVNCTDSLAKTLLGADEVDTIHWHDKRTNKVAEKSVEKILKLVKESKWVVGKSYGSFTLTHPIVGHIFHMQRKGSGATQRHLPLFHLHKGAVFA